MSGGGAGPGAGAMAFLARAAPVCWAKLESEMADHERLTVTLPQSQELVALKGDIEEGLADVAAGRTKDFDLENIITRGRKLLASRSDSAGQRRGS